MPKNQKKRNWAFVLYPESAPENWRELLQKTGLQCCISPLHDKDVNPDKTLKKEHYHVIVCYSGPTSYNVVKVLTDSLNQPIPQALEQVRGYYRYLTHKDNPEKAQYSENDIRTINGFDISDFIELTKSEVKHIMVKLQQIIRAEDFVEYCDFMDYVLDAEELDDTYYDVASNHTFFFDAYLRSRRNSPKLQAERSSKRRKEIEAIVERGNMDDCTNARIEFLINELSELGVEVPVDELMTSKQLLSKLEELYKPFAKNDKK